jgi:hypothetical protein
LPAAQTRDNSLAELIDQDLLLSVGASVAEADMSVLNAIRIITEPAMNSPTTQGR